MEDDLNGGQPQRRTTSMSEDLNGGQPDRKITSMEDDLKVRNPLLNNILIEIELNGSIIQSRGH